MYAVDLNREKFEQLVIREGKTAAVDFWAPWCSYCRRIGPAYEKVAQTRQDILVARINIDECPGLAEQYAIEAIPTILLFRDGAEVDSVVAPESRGQIEALLDQNKEENP